MFKYNNTHIFTGYLKQFLSSFNLPACKIYTAEFAKYLEQHGEEDPRVLESFDTISDGHLAVRINYLKNNELYTYFNTSPSVKLAKGATVKTRDSSTCYWKRSTDVFYTSEKVTHGLTRSLNSSSNYYDTTTHEYLGEYLRFLRDYHNINLMSMYNCFNDKLCNNIYHFSINLPGEKKAIFDVQAPNYRIYAVPVKLFAEYTIAIDCSQGVEMFCGLYNTSLDISDKANKLAAKTYLKINKTLFKQPFLYDKLSIKYWQACDDFKDGKINKEVYTRWDITNREKDLRLFIKVPTSCESSITILEGDYRGFNDAKYANVGLTCRYDTSASTVWTYDETLQTFKVTLNGESYVLSYDINNNLIPAKIAANTAYVRFVKGSAKLDDNHIITNAVNPAEDIEATYKLAFYQSKDNTIYYVNDQLAGTTESTKCLQIYVEDIGRGYYLAGKANNVLKNKYINIVSKLIYSCNHSVLNFNTNKAADRVDLNDYTFKPISKLQLLAFNTGESYPFADRLIEYLTGSAITPMDDIADNIKRAQKVMEDNQYYFKINGLWEDKMQNLLYDYVVNSGPVVLQDGKLLDRRNGIHPRLGHTSKSTLYDILGYIDKDTEKWYANWKKEDGRAIIKSNIQNVDIYNGLYGLD